MLVKILSDSWLSSFPVTSGRNQSFGPITISDFYDGLTNVKKGKANSELEKWIKTTGFFKFYPYELVVGHNVEAFARILNAYNDKAGEYLKKHPNFYLWFHPV